MWVREVSVKSAGDEEVREELVKSGVIMDEHSFFRISIGIVCELIGSFETCARNWDVAQEGRVSTASLPCHWYNCRSAFSSFTEVREMKSINWERGRVKRDV